MDVRNIMLMVGPELTGERNSEEPLSKLPPKAGKACDDVLVLYQSTTAQFQELVVLGAFALMLNWLLWLTTEYADHDLVKQMRERRWVDNDVLLVSRLLRVVVGGSAGVGTDISGEAISAVLQSE